MRTRNSFLNFLANTGSHILNMILSFVVRTVFIYVLAQEYLGVNGLFGNILTVLNLAELGIGTAMIFHLYKPIADNDTAAIRALMNMYRRLYTYVAIFIAAAGLALTPFLDVFIKDKPDLPGLTLIYLLYLLNTVSSYFFCYKRSLIDANQKMWITTLYSTVFTTAQFIVQIIVLVAFRNFIAYLLVQIVCNIATNVALAIKADKMYPFLKEDKKTLPDGETKKSIYKNIGAMSLHRLGDVVVNNTDNLIMSTFVGLISVGIYSNYQMIQYSINVALNGVFSAFTAGIGDLGASENRPRIFEVYKTLLFLGFVLYGYSSVAFMVLYNPFIEVWAGEKYLFDMSVVFLIVANFYLAGMRKVTLTFRDAMGLYWYDRYKPIFEVIINLAASLWLVYKIGICGIFIGTLISSMSTCFWVEPLVTYKYGFHQKVRHYFGIFGLYTLAVFAVGGFTYWVCDFIAMGGLMEVFLKLIVCTLLYNGIILALFCRTREFKELWGQTRRLIENYKNRKQKA